MWRVDRHTEGIAEGLRALEVRKLSNERKQVDSGASDVTQDDEVG